MDSSLYKSIASGDIDQLKQVISGNDLLLLHQVTPLNNTTLQVAVISNKIVCVEEICNRCPTLLTQQNSVEDTPLHIAARLGLSDIVSFLLNQAKINQEDIESIGEGKNDVVGTVPVQRHQLLRMRNKRKDTALHEAVRNRRFEVVKLLTEADPTFEYLECNDAGETPLYLAAEEGLLDCVVQILQTCPASAHVGPRGRTALHAALHLASMSHRANVVKILCTDNRVSKTIMNKDSFTALDPIYHDLVNDPGSAPVSNTFKYMRQAGARNGWRINIIKELEDLACRSKKINHSSMTDQHYTYRGSTRMEVVEKRRQTDLLVAALIATVTFAAGFTIPGGYNSDGQHKGMATLARRPAFIVFMVSNTTAMLLSTFAVFANFWLYPLPLRDQHDEKRIQMHVICADLGYWSTNHAIMAMAVAFLTGTYVVILHSPGLAITIGILGCIFFLLTVFLQYKAYTLIGITLIGGFYIPPPQKR